MKWLSLTIAIIISAASCNNPAEGGKDGNDSSAAMKNSYPYNPDSPTVHPNPKMDLKDSLKKADANKR